MSVSDLEGLMGNKNQAKLILKKLAKSMTKICKKIKQVQKYQDRLKHQQNSTHLNNETAEMLDLKTEMCTLKTKVLQQD
jgi:hypothetical protein